MKNLEHNWTSFTDQFDHSDGELYVVGIDHEWEEFASGHVATVGSGGVRGRDIMSNRPAADLIACYAERIGEFDSEPIDEDKQVEVAQAFLDHLRGNA
jgi:hypothetical protein